MPRRGGQILELEGPAHVTDRPIIFSHDMVQALLAGRKTQTRRLATSPLRSAVAGDRLWVRERFGNAPGGGIWFEADDGDQFAVWSAAIFLPRARSRLTLLVSEVRIQFAHDITEQDALAEGVFGAEEDRGPLLPLSLDPPRVDICRYGQLWDKLHGAGQWHLNPAVVAITFSVSHGNIDRL